MIKFTKTGNSWFGCVRKGPWAAGIAALACLLAVQGNLAAQTGKTVDLLLVNGKVFDGAGNPWGQQDVGISGSRISFVGQAKAARVTARETVDVGGLVVAPGFWDMHSHAALDSSHGREALPMLYQGITTVVLGVDGGGPNNVGETFAQYRRDGVAVNALRYVGHGRARGEVMGAADREPTAAEMTAMKEYIAEGMRQGAVGISSGLFYTPGYFASTGEVAELAKVAAAYGGVYDTHDRDLGASYKGIGYLNSIREAIEIGERAGIPVIFSHFNAQGLLNYGRAPEGARLVDQARARGVNVMAAQHVYTATQSSLRAYAIPRWAVVGGRETMLERFNNPEDRRRLEREIPEMLAIRGGPEKIFFVDQREALSGRTLAEVRQNWNLPVAEAVVRIMREANARVMNLDLYDIENTEFLARQNWMMTCTDGGTPPFGEGLVHPRSYGAFPRKLRRFVYEKKIITLPFALRGMTSLAAGFLDIGDRGLLKEGLYADIAVFNERQLHDKATYEKPHQYAEGMVHVLVNGQFALRNGRPTGALPGVPIGRAGPGSAPVSFGR